MATMYTYRLESVVNFGKYKGHGKTIAQLIKEDLKWIDYQFHHNPQFMLDGTAQVDYLEALKDQNPRLRIGSRWGGTKRTQY